MHLTQRSYVLIVSAAVLGIADIWSADPALLGLWCWPLLVLLGGLAYEATCARRLGVSVQLEIPPRTYLGRQQPAAFAFSNASARRLVIEYAPALPALFEPLPAVRTVAVPARGVGRDPFVVTPVRLGPASLPKLAARLAGALHLAWWSRELPVPGEVAVAPDTLRAVHGELYGNPAGARARRIAGAGSELHQLRRYLRGDALSRIDWKASARAGELITRELSEDQQLDILVALDAGRHSRARAGRLDRYALYANIAARFAELVTARDDRIGLVVFADRPLGVCVPGRGQSAVARLRHILESLTVLAAESDPVAAAVRIRRLLKQRSLILLLTDLDDTSMAEPLARAVRLLSPPHLLVAAGVLEPEIASLARCEAHDESGPWIALAAHEHESRAAAQRRRLRRLGVAVIAAPPEQLEQAVLARYEALRRARRV